MFVLSFAIESAKLVSTIIQGAESVKKAYDYKTKSEFNSTNPDQYDPIGALASIALLRFKEPGTKIQFSENRLFLQQPSTYTYGGIECQGALRTFQLWGSNKKDLKVLLPLIKKAAVLYKPHEDEVIKKLFQNVSKGLESLKLTYIQCSSFTLSDLEKWKDLINSDCENEWECSEEELSSREKEFKTALVNLAKWQVLIKLACEKELECSEEELSFLDQKIKALWSIRQIEKINGLLTNAGEKQGKTEIQKKVLCQTQINTIEQLIEEKIRALQKYIQLNS